jgi:hypothetical protein
VRHLCRPVSRQECSSWKHLCVLGWVIGIIDSIVIIYIVVGV